LKTFDICQLDPSSFVNSYSWFDIKVTFVAVLDDRVGASGAGGASALVMAEVGELTTFPVACIPSAVIVTVIVEPISACANVYVEAVALSIGLPFLFH